MQNLFEEAHAIESDIVEWRRKLHRTPELGIDLPLTSAFVQRTLAEFGIPFTTSVNGSCVTALLGSGEKCILLRSDMDGLPIEEESGEPFAAENGRMHACGHDMHAAILLGAARLLKDRESELKGTVKLVFQPGEETFEGAQAAIDEGLLENPHVDAAYGMHVFGIQPLNTIGCNDGAPLGGVYGFRIVIKGHGGHGSMPETCVDPINAGVHIHLALQELIARETSAMDNAVLTIGKFQAGEASNVIPDSAVLEGTLRTFDMGVHDYLVGRIGEVVQGVAATYRAQASIEVLSDIPPLICDAETVATCKEAVKEALGGVSILDGLKAMGSEDFALIARRVPSAFFSLGAGVENPEERLPQHNPRIRFNEKALAQGAAAYAAAAMAWLEKNA
ncbi:MAG: M20 family metallopeptidase [Slackia sp.]|nr:M20 family metallopeptidase [Slackia sp.]